MTKPSKRVLIIIQTLFLDLLSYGLYLLTRDTGALIFMLVFVTLLGIILLLVYPNSKFNLNSNEGFDKVAKAAKPWLKVVVAWVLVSTILLLITLVLWLSGR
jgi:hypothetical protein